MKQPTTPHRAVPDGSPDGQPGVQPGTRPLRRTPRQKVLAGVCGGLGRYFDIDPVIFRIVTGVLAVTGGIGLIFYGFAWLLIPLEDEEENEGRRLLSGRVEGAALTAVFLALIGCGLFLTMLGNGGMLTFAALLALTTSGAAVWSQRRRTIPESGPLDPAVAHAVADAPPETKAPPAPESPSWWRDPIVKETPAGVGATGYLWGPESALGPDARGRGDGSTPAPSRRVDPPAIGGGIFFLALGAGYLGARLSWENSPLGTSLQIALACALGVFGLGLMISSILGRTGFGTMLLTVVTAALLAVSAALPKDISTEWVRKEWKPASVAAVKPGYELETGIGTLDLSDLKAPAGETVSTRAEVRAGRLKVLIPEDTRVQLRVTADLGDIKLPGDKPNDIDISPGKERKKTLPAPPGAEPSGTLVLRLDVGIGQVEVTRAAS
ncbi:PspC domain-containing protein [Streptomyces sp. CAU 1734]|uniref:PspC domain-containing protein n=1 Tax=Streptomyces sp. CAU 1734 TaxID=3140360 RepID=UPI0032616003